MRKQNLSKFLLYLVACCALIAVLTGCKGSDGSPGSAGANGSDGIYGPNCVNCHHMSSAQINGIEPIRITLATGATATPGIATVVTAKSVFTSGTTTVNSLGYYWEFMDGLAATAGATVTAATLTVTVTAGQDYRAALVARALPALDRTTIVPVNGFTSELAQNAEFMVWIFGNDGKIYYDIAKVKANNNNVSTYAPVLTSGINNVPAKMPVLLNARGTGPYTWSFTTRPGGSGAALDATNIKNPYFTPDIVGQYVLNVVTTPTGTTVPATDTLTIYAGDWRGAITGVNMNNLTAEGADYGTLVPDSTCTGCHNGSTAPDKFATWKSSGHATRFGGGLNEGGHYGPTCFSCHTVGFVSTAKGNGGFRDQANYSAFIADTAMFASTADSTRYATMSNPTGSYYSLFRESGIQCENCHGPQNANTTGRTASDFSAAHNNATTKTRVSLSSDVCGACHGSPQHHGRFQEWQESETGHASYELAQGEGTNASCAGCHSAQGNLIWIDQLVNKNNPLRGIPSAKITWTADTVQPQTCAVCHDPHNEGMTSGETTDAQPRITGNTPKLPAGFAALGVGKGAQCIICHNTRNGGVGSTAADGTTTGDSYLHEDNDPVFGSVVSTTTANYAAPHSPAQGDVLMGHNAYFMGNSGGNSSLYKSPHATIVDTCVDCHMVKTKPPVEYSGYENTNHRFKASMEICSECHGIDSGLGPMLQADTQAMLDRTIADIQAAVVSQANAIISQGTGTLISSVTLGTSHGSPVANVVYADSTTANGVSLNTLVPLNSEPHRNLAKAIWNYNLINNDNSLGVHNPNFIRTVLGTTDAIARELQ